MSVDVETRTVIERPIDVVYTFASDPTNAPDWYANIARVDWKTEPPARVGSIVAFEARFLGRTLRNDGDPAGFSRFVTPMMSMAMRRANRKDLVKLKEVLESM